MVVALAIPSPADAGPNDPKPGRTTLTGRVERVYVSDRSLPQSQSAALLAIEVIVTSVPQGDEPAGVKIGQRVFVKISKPTRAAEDGEHEPSPAQGDIIEFHLTGSSGVFEAAPDDGFRIVTPGKYQSEWTGLRMKLIPVGEFLMGSPVTEVGHRPDELQHRVTLTKPFYLGIHEVTQFEYRRVTQARPSAFSIGGSSKDKVPKMITELFPVENVTWFDAVNFCNRLSQKDGLAPYYKIDGVTAVDDSIQHATVTIVGGTGYRLPTEAEWEYACRAGSTTPFHFGTEATTTTANTKSPQVAGGYGGVVAKWRELGRTAKVGSFPSNDWGLFDMHGNVAEWCADWYATDYYITNAAATNPTGPDVGVHKVQRGGSWMTSDAVARTASRSYQVPKDAKFFSGFRVARNP